ncbi:hypothetical protein E1B28_010415 [Marasmius oreades]|uniref:DUF6699 domain-containing protein n=1 Tax=Marasmius oreades TaxID=181124 RepID=A0A9P7RXQ6_9AGAR|nr:uncharacterized protein E1B28_010415 [Marasmius oreades]KAG7091375.1 hypothetical protein E1B28_010415 [Marasmius oreades]
MYGRNTGHDRYPYSQNSAAFYHRWDYPWGFNPDQVAYINRRWVDRQWRNQRAAFDANRNQNAYIPVNQVRDTSIFVYRPPGDERPVVLSHPTSASQAPILYHCTPCGRECWPPGPPPPLLPPRPPPVDFNAPIEPPPYPFAFQPNFLNTSRHLKRRRFPTHAVQFPPPLPPSFRGNFKQTPRWTPFERVRSWIDKRLSQPRLNPLIAYTSQRSYPISCDLRCNRPYMAAKSHRRHRVLTFTESFEPATVPPVNMMRLYHPLLPWYIEIKAREVTGITIYELLSVLMQELSCRVTDQEFDSQWVTGDEREAILHAALERDGTSVIRRVDFLMNQTVFNGLEKGESGKWKFHTSGNYTGTHNNIDT